LDAAVLDKERTMFAYLLIGSGIIGLIVITVRLVVIPAERGWELRKGTLRSRGLIVQEEMPASWPNEFAMWKALFVGIVSIAICYFLYITLRYS
jgi:hypothetical protein